MAGAGSRLFDVALEGSVPTGFDNIDIYARAGGQFQALTLTETVTVSDGTLDVDLNTLVDNSLLSAIAVYRAGGSPGNNPPAITSNGGGNTAAVSIAENSAAVTTVTATDPDAGQTLSYSINGGADASKFAINVTTGALAFLTAPNFEAPTDAGGNNVYDVTVQVSDGNGGSDTQAIAVTVTDQNEVPNQLPTITSNGGGNTAAVSIAENSTAVTTVTATDPDAGQTLSYSINGGADASKFAINVTTGALAFLTAPNFEAPTDAGGNNVYDVTVQVSDGNGGSDTQAIAVSVTDQNEPGTGNLVAAINIGGGAYTAIASGVSYVADPGPGSGTITYSNRSGDPIGGTQDDVLYQTYGYGDFTYAFAVPAAGAYIVQIELIEPFWQAAGSRLFDVALEGSVPTGFDNIDIYARAGGQFQALTLTETVTVSDGTLDVDLNTLVDNSLLSAIAVYRAGGSPGNNPPAITSNGGGNTAAVSIAENITAVTTVTATDPDAGQTLSYSINGGADASKFAINVTTGALAFLTAPNFEAPTDAGGNNVYDVTVQVSDGNGGSDTQAIAVTVTNQNEVPNQLPTITSNGGGNTAAVSIAENSTAVTTVTATDPDAGQTLSYSINGGADASKFAINVTTGALAFLTAPNFEAPTDAGGNNVYDVTVQVSDGNGGSDTQAIAVAVQDVTVVTINGTDGAETLTGTDENDVINGLGGNDTLQGLAGNDTLDGGAGTDTATYAASPAGVSVSLTTGSGSGGDAQGDTLSNIENLTGSGFNDVLEGNGGENVLAGGAGMDTVTYEHAASGVTVSLAINPAQNTGGAGTDDLSGFENLTGSAFGDVLTGSSAVNVLSGLAGNDILNGGGGADTLIGGAGNDKFLFTATTDSNPSAADLIADFLHGVDILDFSAIDANTSSTSRNQAFSFAGQNSNVVANSVTWYESSGNTIVQADVDANTTAEFTIVLTGINHNLAASDFIL